MQGKPIEMRHVREVLRRQAQGESGKRIALCVGIACSTVSDILARAKEVGLASPLGPEMSDAALAGALYKRPAASGILGRDATPNPTGRRSTLS